MRSAVIKVEMYLPSQAQQLELAVLSNMCLSQRIADEETLRREVEANVRERNAKAIPIKWKFSTQDARRKLARLYPCVST